MTLFIIFVITAILIAIIRKASSNSGIDTSARIDVRQQQANLMRTNANTSTTQRNVYSTPTTTSVPNNGYYRKKPITELCRYGNFGKGSTERLTAVVGMQYHTDRVGGIYGLVSHEPTNQYNNRAMAVITADGQKIGYIPDSELNDYWVWSDGQPCPFVGFINRDRNGRLYSNIMVITPVNKYIVLDAARRQVEYLTKEYDKTGRFDPHIPDVADEELYQRAYAAHVSELKSSKSSAAATDEKKENTPKAKKAATPRREKWEKYFENFKILDITENAAKKEGRELSLLVTEIVYSEKANKFKTGIYYGVMKLDEEGKVAIYNKNKFVAHVEDKEDFIKFNNGEAVPIIYEIIKEDEDEMETFGEYSWTIDGEAFLPISEEYLKLEMTTAWYGDVEKLPK